MDAAISAGIVQSIAEAIRATQQIARREHIKADRLERVGHFVTCLRRHLGYEIVAASGLRTVLIKALCQKALWYDVGQTPLAEMAPPNWSPVYQISFPEVESWARQARQIAAEKMAPTLVGAIEDGLQDLEAVLQQAAASNQALRALNQDGESLINQLALLAENLCEAHEPD